MTENCNSETPSKIPKLEDTETSNDDGVASEIPPSFKSFEGFKVKRILKEVPESRLVVVEGSFSGDDSADLSSSLVILEKTHFTENEVQGILTKSTALQCLFNNDVYYNFMCQPPIQLNGVKATLIHPASEKHIEKFSARKSFLIEETPLIYQCVTLPHIRESKFDLQWVYNILEHNKEADRIVYEDLDPDCGFILLPDLKWDCRSTSNLYLTGIVCKRDIKSLRDLTSEHLPLLKNILEKGSAAITEKYGLDKSQQRIYFHYQPSYYHLHVHFTSLQFTPPGCNVERAHLLSSVIRNIELKSSYYQDSSLNFLVFEGDPLQRKYHQFITLDSNGATHRNSNHQCIIHPQLRIANLYIRLSSTSKILNTASVLDNSVCFEAIEDEATRIVLKFPVSIKLLDNYKFQPVIEKDYIHLRMPIGVPQGMKSGSENVEVLDLVALSTNAYKSQGKMFNPIVGKDYRVQCAECQSILINRAHFKRVLPLPRASWSEAASDWYCHRHAGDADHQLVPRSTDCLFGSCYHALTSSLLIEGSLETAGRELLCSKCQASVGLMEEGLMNVWCHSIKWFLLEENDQWKLTEDVTTPLQAFYYTLYDALEEEKSFFGRKLAFRDGLGGDQTLLLWFVGDNGFTLDSKKSSSGAEIELRQSALQKVLYKSENSTKKKIPNDVSEYQVSREMMNSALVVLRNSSEQLPVGCRTAAGFSIGYLPLSS